MDAATWVPLVVAVVGAILGRLSHQLWPATPSPTPAPAPAASSHPILAVLEQIALGAAKKGLQDFLTQMQASQPPAPPK
jgi:hypothetical protein